MQRDPVLIKEWVQAMRSGKYQQTSGIMSEVCYNGNEQETCYCALGVLCDLWINRHPDKMRWEHAKNHSSFRLMRVDGIEFEFMHYPPKEVMEAAGMDNLGLTFNKRKFIDRRGFAWNSVSQANDDGIKFSELAEMIERTLLETGE